MSSYLIIILCLIVLEERKAESDRIRAKYNDRIPVIVEKAAKSDIPDVDKQKYLVPSDLTVAQFTHVIRKRIRLPAERALFFFVNKNPLNTSTSMSQVFDQYVDRDGFLYITYSGENTFGSH